MAGILSAIMLAEKGMKVHLIESTGSLGGLLRSFQSPEGFTFDYGTHFLRETGNNELDKLLYGGLRWTEWQKLKVLKNGNYFYGLLNEKSPFIDSRLLPKEIYEEGLKEFFEIKPDLSNFNNLAKQLQALYGSTFYKYIYEPVIRGFFHQDPNELAPNSHVLAGLSLILIESASETRKLKEEQFMNSRIGFHSFEEGVSSFCNFYPRIGGIGRWIDHLAKRADDAGVEISLNCNLVNAEINNCRVEKFTLNEGSTIECDHLIWTVPPAIFLKVLGEKTFGTKPKSIHTHVCHFVADQPPITDLYFFACHDPSMSTYRVTLHSNCQPESKERYCPFTVESLSGTPVDIDAEAQIIHSELLKMRVFPKDAKLRLINAETLANGFPIPTIELKKQAEADLRKARQIVDNVTFVGKGSGESFFMNEVLLNTFKEINEKVLGYTNNIVSL